MRRISYIPLTLLLLIITSFQAFSQLRCGTMQRWTTEIKDHPQLIQKRQKIENDIIKWQKSTTLNSYNIPVVFHILYENESENISIEQIQSQLDVLNQDFNRTNPDANQTPEEFLNVAANCNINFCLAQRSPNNDSTSGITYTQTDISSFSLYDNRIFHDSLGGKTIWNSERYLNIYVCDLTNALGFSSFPGGIESRDAVVINYSNFGTVNVSPPFNKGRTATHEIGHWLNLLHIWGDSNCGNDQVQDTPIQDTENYGCPSHPSPTCSNNGDMFQNFMDYTDDACMNLFTEGQKVRMHATINSQRTGLVQSQACLLPYEDIGINENISPANNQEYCGYEFELITSLYNYSNSSVYESQIYFQIDDEEIQMIEWSGDLLPNSSVEINLGNYTLSAGQHTLLIFSSSPNGFRDLNPNNDTLAVNFKLKYGSPFEFQIQTDNYAEENRWEILNDNNEIIAYENELVSNHLNTFSFCQDVDSCYTLVIYDEYEDGICCDFGNGFISINNQVFNGNFNSEIEFDLCTISTIKDLSHQYAALVYPNPSNGILTIESPFIIESIRIYDLMGKIVLEKNCHNKEEELNLYHLNKGPYLALISTQNEYTQYQKIIIQ